MEHSVGIVTELHEIILVIVVRYFNRFDVKCKIQVVKGSYFRNRMGMTRSILWLPKPNKDL
jgi:hypothetical protein